MERTASQRSFFVLALAGLASAGCQGEPTAQIDGVICVGDGCDAPVPPISGRGVVDCWISPADETRRYDLLDCRYQPPGGYPVTLSGARVSGEYVAGGGFSGEIQEVQAGQVLSIAKIAPTSYPIELTIDIAFDPTDRSIPSLEGLDKVRSTFELNPEVRADDPLSANIPFDLWYVELLGRDSNYSALSFGYGIDVGAGDDHHVALKTRPLLFGHIESFYLPVSPGSPAEAKMVFEDTKSSQVEITGPGRYVVRDGALAAADFDDLPQYLEGGSEVARCWFQNADYGFEQLHCQAQSDRGIELATAVVDIVRADGMREQFNLSAESTFVTEVSSREFPLEIAISGEVSSNILGLEELAGSRLQAMATVAPSKLPRIITPQTLEVPFEVWEVTIDNQTEGFQGVLDSYVLELGRGVTDRFATLVEGVQTPFVAESSSQNILVAAPIGGTAITGDATVIVAGQEQEIQFELRPGAVVIGK